MHRCELHHLVLTSSVQGRDAQTSAVLLPGTPCPLRLLLNCFDGSTVLIVIDPRSPLPLRKKQSDPKQNTKAQFGIGEGLHQFGVDCLLLLLQALAGLSDLPAA